MNDNLKVFPNPPTDVVNIKYTVVGKENLNIKLKDATGKTLQEKNVVFVGEDNQTSFVVKNYISGLYFIQVSNGKSFAIKKIIINN